MPSGLNKCFSFHTSAAVPSGLFSWMKLRRLSRDGKPWGNKGPGERADRAHAACTRRERDGCGCGVEEGAGAGAGGLVLVLVLVQGAGCRAQGARG